MKQFIPEKDIQKAILDYLKLRKVLCRRINSGKAFGSNNGKKWVINIGDAGWPDIIGVTPEGRFFGIEVKAAKGILTDLQESIGRQIIASKGIWFVARDLDDVIARGF